MHPIPKQMGRTGKHTVYTSHNSILTTITHAQWESKLTVWANPLGMAHRGGALKTQEAGAGQHYQQLVHNPTGKKSWGGETK